MQKQAGDFLVSRTLTLFKPGGETFEVYELPNGQWQIGKGRDAQIVTALDQVFPVPPGSQWVDKQNLAQGSTDERGGWHAFEGDVQALKSITAWVTRMQSQTPPIPVLQGQTPALAGLTARDQLSQAIANMSDEVVNRLLMAVVQTVGPVADSIKQGREVNSHGDGFGYVAPVAPPPFLLPLGGQWCDPGNHAAGYFTSLGMVDDKGVPMKQWHPTPEFAALQERPDSGPSAETAGLHVHNPDVEEEIAQARRGTGADDLVGAGTGRRSTRRR